MQEHNPITWFVTCRSRTFKKSCETMSYHCTPTRMANIRKSDNTKFWQRCRAGVLLTFIAEGIQNSPAALNNGLAVNDKAKHSFIK